MSFAMAGEPPAEFAQRLFQVTPFHRSILHVSGQNYIAESSFGSIAQHFRTPNAEPVRRFLRLRQELPGQANPCQTMSYDAQESGKT
jgi:hypothetical protein